MTDQQQEQPTAYLRAYRDPGSIHIEEVPQYGGGTDVVGYLRVGDNTLSVCRRLSWYETRPGFSEALHQARYHVQCELEAEKYAKERVK